MSKRETDRMNPLDGAGEREGQMRLARPSAWSRAKLAAKAAVGIFTAESLTQAHSMLAGIFPGAIGTPPERGTRELLKAYTQAPWLRAVVAKIATSIAATEWQLYVIQKPGGRAEPARWLQRMARPRRKARILELVDDRRAVQLFDHVMLEALNNPNSILTGNATMKVTAAQLELVGEAFWLKERNELGVVTGFWPVPAYWILQTPTPRRPAFRVSFRGWQGFIPDTEWVWFIDPDPWHPYARGSGTGRTLADEIDTDESAAKMSRTFFYNQARPDILLWPKDGSLKQEVLDRLQQEWRNQHEGFWRAWRPFFSPRELGIHEFDVNLRSLQFTQLRQAERDIIIHTHGVPEFLLGVMENANRASAATAEFVFAKWVVVPRLEAIRAILQERLVPEYDDRLVIDYASPVDEDNDFRLQVGQAAPWSLNIDEWRAMSGHKPLANGAGRVHIVPTATQPLTFTGAPAPLAPSDLPLPTGPVAEPAPDIAPVGPVPGSGPIPPTGITPMASWRVQLRRDAVIFKEAGDTASERLVTRALDALDDEELPALTRLAARLEPKLRREFIAAVEATQAAIELEALAEAVEGGDVAAIAVAARTALTGERLRSGAGAVIQQAFTQGADIGNSALTDAGITARLDITNARAVEWARTRSAALVVEVDQSTREAIQEIITQAFEVPRTPQQTARAIRDVVGLTDRQARAVENFRTRLLDDGVSADLAERRASRYAAAQLRLRADTISRTEVMTASGEGQRELWSAAERAGHLVADETERVWIATHDELLEELCEDLDGSTAPLRGDYRGKSGRQHVKGPPRHPRCRCAEGLKFVRAPAARV